MNRVAPLLLSLCFVLFSGSAAALYKPSHDTCNSNVQCSTLASDCCVQEICQWQQLLDALTSHERPGVNLAFSWGFVLGAAFAVLVALAIAGAYYVYLVVTNSPLSSPVDLRTTSTTDLNPPNSSPSSSIDQYQSRGRRQPPKAIYIGDSNCLVLSPINSPREEIPAIWGPIPDPDSRGRASAVVQQTSPGLHVHSNPDSGEHQAQDADQHPTNTHPNLRPDSSPDDNTLRQFAPPAKRHLSWVYVSRALTDTFFTIRQLSRSSTLFGSLTGLPFMRSVFVNILGVGLSWDKVPGKYLPGPRHDMAWLGKLCSTWRHIQFDCLMDDVATYGAIRERMRRMYYDATTETYLIFYFAGHGTEDNALELYDSSSLNEVVLNEWIVEFRRETSKHVPVYIIFDFCRESRVEPKPDLAEDVHIIWACSPFQSALDLRLPSKGGKDEDLPRSCFLIATILAINDASKDATVPPKRYLATRMKELVTLVRGIRCFRLRCNIPWYLCRCEVCSGGDLCIRAKHSEAEERRLFQVVSISTLKEDPNFAAVVQFVANNFPLHVQRVTRQVANNQWFMFFNTTHIVANKGSIKPRHLPRKDMNMAAETAVRQMTVPGGLDVL